jgi:hypothetical protein
MDFYLVLNKNSLQPHKQLKLGVLWIAQKLVENLVNIYINEYYKHIYLSSYMLSK